MSSIQSTLAPSVLLASQWQEHREHFFQALLNDNLASFEQMHLLDIGAFCIEMNHDSKGYAKLEEFATRYRLFDKLNFNLSHTTAYFMSSVSINDISSSLSFFLKNNLLNEELINRVKNNFNDLAEDKQKNIIQVFFDNLGYLTINSDIKEWIYSKTLEYDININLEKEFNAFLKFIKKDNYSNSLNITNKTESMYDLAFFHFIKYITPEDHHYEKVNNMIINHNWSNIIESKDSMQRLRSILSNTQHIDWLTQILSQMIEQNSDKPIAYLKEMVQNDLIQYVIEKGDYQEFKNFALLDTHKLLHCFEEKNNNQQRHIEQTLLYQLALRGKKLEFNDSLKLYSYCDEIFEEYQKQNKKQDIFQTLFKDDIHILKEVLTDHQEYSILDSLEQYYQTNAPKNLIEQGFNIDKKHEKKNFFSFVDYFSHMFTFNKKEEAVLLEVQKEENQHVLPKNHTEFIQSLNEYAQLSHEKREFLIRKIKINSSIDNQTKKEVSEQIENISKNSLIIEKILEQEYSVKNVEEYVRYKSLTGRYFIRAVEQLLTVTTEAKNILQENDLTLYIEQFREQVKFINRQIDDLKDNLKSNRQNELLMEMQADVQLLRLKQNG